MKTRVFKIHPVYPEMDKIAECGNVINNGGLVVFPTETVYGIAADFGNAKAVARLREVKKRKKDKPFSALISKKDDIDLLANPLGSTTYKLIDKFWPGPLTVVVPAKKENETIGLRMPGNVIALSLVREAQCPLAAPSANFEDQRSPVTCEEALENLNGLVDIAIDGGPTTLGKASCVVDITTSQLKVLRQGPISEEDIDHIANQKAVLFVCTGNSCRSVMAEYILRDMLDSKKNVSVLSAGMSVYVSMGASDNTIEILKRENIDVSKHRSQPVSKTMLQKSDFILTMTRQHRQQVLSKAPSVENRVYPLKEFASMTIANDNDLDIVDPMGRPMPEYEECLKIIKEAIVKIVDLI